MEATTMDYNPGLPRDLDVYICLYAQEIKMKINSNTTQSSTNILLRCIEML